jgi:hypothetical protein
MTLLTWGKCGWVIGWLSFSDIDFLELAVDLLLDHSSVVESVLHMSCEWYITLWVPPGEFSFHSSSSRHSNWESHSLGILGVVLLGIGSGDSDFPMPFSFSLCNFRESSFNRDALAKFERSSEWERVFLSNTLLEGSSLRLRSSAIIITKRRSVNLGC